MRGHFPNVGRKLAEDILPKVEEGENHSFFYWN